LRIFKLDAFIISYFGKKPELRKTRYGLHYQQLICLLEQPGIEDIHILAMDYANNSITTPENNLKFPHPRIHYHDSEVVPPSKARNKLMKIFNATNKPWGMFADNDAVIDPRHDGRDIINIIERNTKILNRECDLLVPLCPMVHPFNGYLDKFKLRLDDEMPVERNNWMKGSLFWLKNRSISNQEPIYFNEDMATMEDAEYVPRLLSNKASVWLLRTVILTDLGIHDSTLFPQDKKGNQSRVDDMDKVHLEMYERFKSGGCKLAKSGRIDMKAMMPINADKTLWLDKNPSLLTIPQI